MPSDYAAMARENQVEYGRSITRWGKRVLVDQYSDRTHFIFELLQNAEDACATRIVFRLYSNRLEVQHNGNAFNERDVIAICGIDASTSPGNLGRIGRFGIGFKSVYAYTRNPEIHSGDEHFRIKGYVIPEIVEHDQLLNETLIILPFDHESISPDQSFTEISERLRSIDTNTILFLRCIKEIEWIIHPLDNGKLMKITLKEASDYRHVRVTRELPERRFDHWLIFDRSAPD